ncbi:MAG TPA: thioredoxin domain-containing protein, partial [Myxococcota bacterium]|nr:thioredoxin domain-containing protein [Myxococcota bacterium]
KQRAFLDDLAAVLAAALDLHRAGAGDRWLAAGLSLADEIVAHFYDPAEADLFLTPDDGERLVHRPRSDHDGATPHSTGYAVLGLLRAASLSGRTDLQRVAERVLRTHAFVLERAGLAYPTLLRAAAGAARGFSVAVVMGDPASRDTRELARAARLALGPDDGVVVTAPGAAPAGLDRSWLEGRDPAGGRATAWICRGTTCSLPLTDPGELRAAPAQLGA